ncbi:MAG TPA: hypothetical protein DDW20_06320 [Firmicutes bacterium]|nr:hypothetical protein [Bacillota bacterium]
MDYLKDRVTIYEVAKASGVSLATVSRVINKQSNVTPETRAKVEATIARLGYKPSGLAQALATNKSTNIGVVIPSANYVYISNMLNGITEVAKEKGFTLSLFVTAHSREDALRMLEKVITSHVDGAIIFDDELDEEDVAKLSSYRVPCIVINNKVEGDNAGCIVFGYEHNLRHILEHHFEKEDNKLPIFLHVHNCGRLLARTEKAFIRACNEANKEYHIMNVDDSYTRTYQDFKDYFANHKEGYFIAYRDSIAAAVANAATDSGLRIPEDVEVLSLIGTKYANIVRPTLSSMNIDMQEVGKRAMYMLIDLSNNELEQKTYRFESTYIKRNSTKE